MRYFFLAFEQSGRISAQTLQKAFLGEMVKRNPDLKLMYQDEQLPPTVEQVLNSGAGRKFSPSRILQHDWLFQRYVDFRLFGGSFAAKPEKLKDGTPITVIYPSVMICEPCFLEKQWGALIVVNDDVALEYGIEKDVAELLLAVNEFAKWRGWELREYVDEVVAED